MKKMEAEKMEAGGSRRPLKKYLKSIRISPLHLFISLLAFVHSTDYAIAFCWPQQSNKNLPHRQ